MTEWLAADRLGEVAAGEVRAWFAACRASPGMLPPDCSWVQGRLIRVVGRGALTGIGPVFVKLMAFPRPKDRLRYVHRRLPAVHEAAVLRCIGARTSGELPCPEPLAVLAERGPFHLPRLSLLLTRGLAVADRQPELADRARAAARLCAIGVEHGDLHAGNFVALEDGRTAVLDLQSARVRRAPLPARRRLAVAAKLAEGVPAAALDALVEGGLVEPAELPAVSAVARHLEAAAAARRIRRCLTESTEFAVRRRLGGSTVVRRATGRAALVAVADAEARRLWLGDRALEVLDGERPRFAGYRTRALGAGELLVEEGRAGSWQIDRERLLAGFARYEDLRSRS
jgi:hypothetical protein